MEVLYQLSYYGVAVLFVAALCHLEVRGISPLDSMGEGVEIPHCVGLRSE